jgi:SAM-dependent methyltransferase
MAGKRDKRKAGVEEDPFPTNGINGYLGDYLASVPVRPGMTALDLPAGDGRASSILLKRGVKVLPFDLFPKAFRASGAKCRFADMTQRIPLPDHSVDLVVCQEGIEHIPDQLSLLTEFNRVLRKGGTLVLTTPNQSHFRARLSTMLVGSDLWKRLPPSEIDGIWFSEGDKYYFGHLFLLGVNQLWTLSRLAGFDVTETKRTDLGGTSLFLGILLGPFLLLAYGLAYLFSLRKLNPGRSPALKGLLREQARINLSPKALFCKHIFWVLRKSASTKERAGELLRNVASKQWQHPR